MKTAIVTGATGFLGGALVTELTKKGIYVYALCRKNSQRLLRMEGLDNVHIIEVDLNDLTHINGFSSDVFYHVAWEGPRNDFNKQYKNIAQALHCVSLAAKLGCKRFIGLGSQAEYGSINGIITEESPLKPITAYGSCKVAAYYLTTDLANRLGIEHIWARVFSVYGPHDNPNSLIPQLIAALQNNSVFSLVSDGMHIWNYLHEEDAARVLRLLGEREGISGVYNVASRESKPLREYVEIVRECVNKDAVVRYGSEKSEVKLKVDTGKLLASVGEFERTKFYGEIFEKQV